MTYKHAKPFLFPFTGCMSNTNSVKKQVVVNRNTLQKVLQEVISATDGITSLELLLDLYAQLRGVINKHLKIHIRTTLPAVSFLFFV